MGMYSKLAKKMYLESGNLCDKKTEDYYKSRMFYGYSQVLIDANSESEAKLFQARAINDFDIFCKYYKVDNGDKLNGIILKPVGEDTNLFIACTTGIDKSKSFEHVLIQEGRIISAHKKTIVRESDEVDLSPSGSDTEKPTPQVKEEVKPEENKQEEVKESNLAIDF